MHTSHINIININIKLIGQSKEILFCLLIMEKKTYLISGILILVPMCFDM